MAKFKKIINLGPGYSNIVVTGNSIDEVTEKYKKELAKISPLIGHKHDGVPHTVTDIEEKKPEPKRLIDRVVKKKPPEEKKVTDIDLEKKTPKVKSKSVPITKPQLKIDEKIITHCEWPNNDKPRIVCVTDVTGWAWWIKSQYLIKHLSNDFNFIVIAAQEKSTNWKNLEADLYLTFGWDFYHRLSNVDKKRVISGITAHKEKSTWQNGAIKTLKQCQWVHANSLLLKEALEESGIENVYYVPNGVDEQLFVEKKPVNLYTEKLVAGHVGKLAGLGGKGQKDFLEPAAAQAGVIWKGHYNNYSNRVEHSKMVDFYQGIDVFCVASITDGTPNGAFEASACARPVISNRIGNMPEFIVDGVNGFLIERKVDAYVEKMKLLNDDRDLCYNMGQAARKTIEEGWTWTIMAENYRKMFWDILKKIG